MYNISVIIPTYNREKLIKRSIESVISQKGHGNEYVIREIIVIDDCSTDNTEEALKSINDSRIKYCRLEKNSGAAAARNRGVDLAEGDWIAFQDSDDIWHSDKIIKQVGYLKKYTGVSLVSHPVRAVFDDGKEIVTESISGDDIVPFLACRNYFDTPTILVKKESFLGISGFVSDLKALEDWDFMLRYADRYKVGMVPEVLIDSNMMSNGVSSDAADYYESRCQMIARNKELLIRHNCFDDAVKSLLLHAKRNDVLETVGKILELNLKIL